MTELTLIVPTVTGHRDRALGPPLRPAGEWKTKSKPIARLCGPYASRMGTIGYYFPTQVLRICEAFCSCLQGLANPRRLAKLLAVPRTYELFGGSSPIAC